MANRCDDCEISIFSPGVCYRCQPGACDQWSGADQDMIKALCNKKRYVGSYIEIICYSFTLIVISMLL